MKRWTFLGTLAGAVRLSLTNTGSKPCKLGNHAGLQLEKADGQDLPTHVHNAGTAGTITVAAGATARAELAFRPKYLAPVNRSTVRASHGQALQW